MHIVRMSFIKIKDFWPSTYVLDTIVFGSIYNAFSDWPCNSFTARLLLFSISYIRIPDNTIYCNRMRHPVYKFD